MKSYLACIKKVKGVNENQCRELAKAYLSCRMDRSVPTCLAQGLRTVPALLRLTWPVHHSDLMAKDDFKNLGFQNAAEDAASSKAAGGSGTQAKRA